MIDKEIELRYNNLDAALGGLSKYISVFDYIETLLHPWVFTEDGDGECQTAEKTHAGWKVLLRAYEELRPYRDEIQSLYSAVDALWYPHERAALFSAYRIIVEYDECRYAMELAGFVPADPPTSTRNHGKIAAGHCLPDVLGTDDARKYFAQLAALGLMETNERGALIWKGTKKELALTAELMSEKLRISQKWKVFERVFNVCNLAQARYRAVEIDGRYGDNEDDIKAIFK